MTLLRGAAYYPEHRDPQKWDADLETMAQAHLNCLRVGEFAWSRFEPAQNIYDFDWLDRFSERAAAFDIQLLLCPPLRTAPAWLVEADPTVLLEREDGLRLAYGSRYTFCINHPLLRERGAALAAALARRYSADANVVGYHLDNEHGDEPDCHCPICTAQFRAWCERRYGEIDALNDAWGTVFWSMELTHFGQIPTPRVTKAPHNPGHLLAWRRFRSEATINAVALQADAVREHRAAHQAITTNNQPLWNHRTDYYALAEHLDVAGTNYYPPYESTSGAGDGAPLAISLGLTMCRSYKQQPFQVHELRNGPHMIPGAANNTPAPGEVARLTMHTIANGADAAFYFRWRTSPFGCEQSHGSPTDYDGRPNRIHAEVRDVFARLARLAPTLAGTNLVSDVGLLMDFPTRWIMESGVHWTGPQTLYMDQAKRLHAAIRAQGVNCDAVSRHQAFTPYKILVVPALAAMDDALADKLVAYVAAGGLLLWHPLSGIKDAEARIYPGRLHPTLAPLLGADITEFATAGPAEAIPFTWQQKQYAGRLFCDLPALQGAESWGTYTDVWFAGTPAVTRRAWGAGAIIHITTFAGDDFYRDLFNVLTNEAGIPRLLPGPLPPALEVTERRDGEGRRLLFVLNTGQEALSLHLDAPLEDLYNEETVAGAVTLPPYGVRVLRRMGE